MFSKLSKCVCLGSALGLAAGVDGLKLSLTQRDGDTIFETQHREDDPFSDTSDDFATICQQEKNRQRNNDANKILDRHDCESQGFVQDPVGATDSSLAAATERANALEDLQRKQQDIRRKQLADHRKKQKEESARRCKAASEERMRTHHEVQRRLNLIYDRHVQAELAAELKAAEEAKRGTVTKKKPRRASAGAQRGQSKKAASHKRTDVRR